MIDSFQPQTENQTASSYLKNLGFVNMNSARLNSKSWKIAFSHVSASFPVQFDLDADHCRSLTLVDTISHSKKKNNVAFGFPTLARH